MKYSTIKYKPDDALKESKLQAWKQLLSKTEKSEIKNDPRGRD